MSRVAIAVLGLSLLVVTALPGAVEARGLRIRIGGGPIGVVRSVAGRMLALRGMHGRHAARARMANVARKCREPEPACSRAST